MKTCTWPSETPPDTQRRQAGRARQMGRGAVSAPGQWTHLGDAVRIPDDPNTARCSINFDVLDWESDVAIGSDESHVFADCGFDGCAVLGQAGYGDDNFVIRRPKVPRTAGFRLVDVRSIQESVTDKIWNACYGEDLRWWAAARIADRRHLTAPRFSGPCSDTFVISAICREVNFSSIQTTIIKLLLHWWTHGIHAILSISRAVALQ